MNTPLSCLLQRLDNVRQDDEQYTARCPAHDDRKNSLSLSEGDKGQVLLYCHAGCSLDAILDRLQLRRSDLFFRQEHNSSHMDILDTYDYTDENGKLLFQVARLFPKDFRPRRPAEGNKWVWNLKDTRRVLYRLPEVIAAIQQGEQVFVVEGEKDADALHKLGLTATTNVGGACKWKREYSEAMRGARVVILRDNDEAGKKHRDQVAAGLQGYAASVLAPELEGLPDKGDVSDWIAQGGTAEQLLRIVEQSSPYEATSTPQRERKQNKRSHGNGDEEESLSTAQQLVALGREQTQRFHSAEEGDAFVRFPVLRVVNGQKQAHFEIWPVRSKAFREWLARQFYEETERVPNSQAMEDALRVLEGDCRFEGEAFPLSVRVADGSASPREVWLDLSDAEWRVIRVSTEGWQLVESPAILFRRFALAAPQTLPGQGGSLQTLREFVNVRDEDAWYQMIAWLVAALLPNIAHPVLVVHGEHGSAKSTLMRLLSMLIDPVKTPLRAEPRDIAEWVQAAHHCWLVTLDNVSHLPNWLSDAICRAVTGEGFSKRQLYTDGDDIILTFRRVVALTGIEVVAQRADLLDRSILLALSPITSDQRRLESEVLAEFEQARPALLGALLEVVAGVLRVLPDIRLERLPRMADFARIGVAVERVLEWPEGAFLKAYQANVATQHEEALEASPVAISLRAFMQKRETWTGTASELLKELPTDNIDTRGREWPKTPRGLSGQLKRLAPNLRAIGLHIGSSREPGTGQRLITLAKQPVTEDSSSTASQSSQPSGASHEGVTEDQEPVTNPQQTEPEPSQSAPSHGDASDRCDEEMPFRSGRKRQAENPLFDYPPDEEKVDNLGAFRH